MLAFGKEFFREMHAAELDKHEKLHGRIALPTAIITVLCGVISLYIQRCPSNCFVLANTDNYVAVFLACVVLLFLAVFGAIVCVIFALLQNQYRYPSDPDAIKEYLLGMETYLLAESDAGNTKREAIPGLLEADLNDMMSEQYLECAATNRVVNSKKGSWIYLSYWAIILALICSGVSLVPFQHVCHQEESIQKVEIVKVP